MKRTISAVEARKRFGDMLSSVYWRGDEVFIERAGKRMAVVIPVSRNAVLERERERLMELIQMNWEKNKDVPADVIEAEIQQAIDEVRAEARARREGPTKP